MLVDAKNASLDLRPRAGADQCPQCGLLRTLHESAWQRGHRVGLNENARIARDAQAALARERQAHADTNAKLTEALLLAEAEIERLKAERDRLQDAWLAAIGRTDNPCAP